MVENYSYVRINSLVHTYVDGGYCNLGSNYIVKLSIYNPSLFAATTLNINDSDIIYFRKLFLMLKLTFVNVKYFINILQ